MGDGFSAENRSPRADTARKDPCLALTGVASHLRVRTFHPGICQLLLTLLQEAEGTFLEHLLGAPHVAQEDTALV